MLDVLQWVIAANLGTIIFQFVYPKVLNSALNTLVSELTKKAIVEKFTNSDPKKTIISCSYSGFTLFPGFSKSVNKIRSYYSKTSKSQSNDLGVKIGDQLYSIGNSINLYSLTVEITNESKKSLRSYTLAYEFRSNGIVNLLRWRADPNPYVLKKLTSSSPNTFSILANTLPSGKSLAIKFLVNSTSMPTLTLSGTDLRNDLSLDIKYKKAPKKRDPIDIFPYLFICLMACNAVLLISWTLCKVFNLCMS